MKKKIFLSICTIIMITILAGTMMACSNNGTSSAGNIKDNTSPDALYKADNDTDLLVYENTAYVNAATTDWVMELELAQDKKLGEIKRTNVTKKFKDFDATYLDVGTEVYSAIGRKDILLANINNMMVPYLKIVEG